MFYLEKLKIKVSSITYIYVLNFIRYILKIIVHNLKNTFSNPFSVAPKFRLTCNLSEYKINLNVFFFVRRTTTFKILNCVFSNPMPVYFTVKTVML